MRRPSAVIVGGWRMRARKRSGPHLRMLAIGTARSAVERSGQSGEQSDRTARKMRARGLREDIGEDGRRRGEECRQLGGHQKGRRRDETPEHHLPHKRERVVDAVTQRGSSVRLQARLVAVVINAATSKINGRALRRVLNEPSSEMRQGETSEHPPIVAAAAGSVDVPTPEAAGGAREAAHRLSHRRRRRRCCHCRCLCCWCRCWRRCWRQRAVESRQADTPAPSARWHLRTCSRRRRWRRGPDGAIGRGELGLRSSDDTVGNRMFIERQSDGNPVAVGRNRFGSRGSSPGGRRVKRRPWRLRVSSSCSTRSCQRVPATTSIMGAITGMPSGKQQMRRYPCRRSAPEPSGQQRQERCGCEAETAARAAAATRGLCLTRRHRRAAACAATEEHEPGSSSDGHRMAIGTR